MLRWVICKDKSSLPEAFLVKDVMKICMGSENKLRHGCSPVNLLHIFRTPFIEDLLILKPATSFGKNPGDSKLEILI